MLTKIHIHIFRPLVSGAHALQMSAELSGAHILTMSAELSAAHFLVSALKVWSFFNSYSRELKIVLEDFVFLSRKLSFSRS